MDTLKLLGTNFSELERKTKRGKDKDRDFTPVEKQRITDLETAKEIVKKCCTTCSRVEENIQQNDNELCNECYAMYNDTTKRFWLARYKKVK